MIGGGKSSTVAASGVVVGVTPPSSTPSSTSEFKLVVQVASSSGNRPNEPTLTRRVLTPSGVMQRGGAGEVCDASEVDFRNWRSIFGLVITRPGVIQGAVALAERHRAANRLDHVVVRLCHRAFQREAVTQVGGN